MKFKNRTLPHSVTVGFFGILLILSLLLNIAIFKKLDEQSQSTSPQTSSVTKQLSGVTAGKKIIDGKVWVQIPEPIFTAYFLSDESCGTCVSLDAIKSEFEKMFPTANIKEISVSSEKGKEMLAAGVTVVPAIILDSSFASLSSFDQLVKGGVVTPVGESKYLEFRTSGNKKILSESQLPQPPEGAEILVAGYTDFFSQDAAAFSAIMPQIAAKFGNKVAVQNNLMVSDLPSAYVAQALRCEVDAEKITKVQEKYAKAVQDILADAEGKQQDEIMDEISKALEKELQLWGKKRDCYRKGEFVKELMGNAAKAQQLGITGTPAYFVGNRFLAGPQKVGVFAAALAEVAKEKGLEIQAVPVAVPPAPDVSENQEEKTTTPPQEEKK